MQRGARECDAAHASVREYAPWLIAARIPMEYRGRDCGDFFLKYEGLDSWAR